MHRILLIALLSLFIFPVLGQESLNYKSFFFRRDFGHYAFADRYAPRTNIGFGAMFVANDYNVDPESRRVAMDLEPIIGAQLPIYYARNQKYRWSITLPVSFSVWFDYTEKRTSPILNTDYRFAFLELNYSYKLKNCKLNNIGFRFTPFAHESTHVGDELIMAKIADSIPYARINVSYETYEFSIIINDTYNQKIKNHSIRLGAKFLWNPNKGYYTADSSEVGNGIEILPSTRWVEPFIQYQFQNPNGRLSNDRMLFIFSLDFTLRVRYGYPFNYADNDGNIIIKEKGEAYQMCSNSLLGWKLLNAKKEISNIGVFIKLYIGINPHGQFRNIPKYPWLGLNFIYDI